MRKLPLVSLTALLALSSLPAWAGPSFIEKFSISASPSSPCPGDSVTFTAAGDGTFHEHPSDWYWNIRGDDGRYMRGRSITWTATTGTTWLRVELYRGTEDHYYGQTWITVSDCSTGDDDEGDEGDDGDDDEGDDSDPPPTGGGDDNPPPTGGGDNDPPPTDGDDDDPPPTDGDDDDDPSPTSSCVSRITPYWHGTGGFAVRPTDGRSATVRVSCGSNRWSSQEFAGEDGLIVRAVQQSMCLDEDEQPVWGELAVEGVDDDGWYWINGDRNVAVAPLVCESSLNSGLRPPVPAGVTASPGADRRFSLSVMGRLYGTLMVHDFNGLVGIIPHLKDMEGNGEHVAPYWRGHGGVVGRPLDGESATVRLSCGDGAPETHTLLPGDDGIIVSLLPGCFDIAGDPIDGRLEADGLEDGAWYWLNQGRLATGTSPKSGGTGIATAVPLVRRESAPGTLAEPVVPNGVEARPGPLGTLFTRGRLMGVVPRVQAAEQP